MISRSSCRDEPESLIEIGRLYGAFENIGNPRRIGLNLNLGCGQSYKTGYLNLDISEHSLADVVADVSFLPIRRSCIDLIEASQLIEHFDFIHAKYALSDWFASLKPCGKLVIETPDIIVSLKKLKSRNVSASRNTVHWLYGIDSPGLRHKTGFTFRILSGLLGEIGFEHIKRERAKTHLYEKGMRITCSKPLKCNWNESISHIKSLMRQKMKIDDSYLLIPLDEHVTEIRNLLLDEKIEPELRMKKALSISACVSPEFSLILLDEFTSSGTLQDEAMSNTREVLAFLLEIGFHRRLFALWMKTKKNGHCVDEAFREFIGRNAGKMESILSTGRPFDEELSYLTGLRPEEIPFLDLTLILMEADRQFNEGIRQFDHGNLDDAVASFSKSIQMNPFNPLSHWNLARIGLIHGDGASDVRSSYERALRFSDDRSVRNKIEKELELVGNGQGRVIEYLPVTIDDIRIE